jgi:O-antigen/teichoic acid export membrane protein
MDLGRGIQVRLAGHVTAGLVSLAALPLLVRHLGVADFGRYVAVLSVIGIAALASDLGVTGLTLREAALMPAERRHDLLAGLLGVRAGLAALGAVAAAVFAVAAGYGSSVVLGAAVAAAGLFPQVFTDMVVAHLTVESRFATATLVETARSVAGTVLVLLLVLADAELPLFLAAWGVAALIGALLARRASTASVPLRPRAPDAATRALLRDARSYSLATVLHVVYFRATMVVTSLSGSAVQAGYFGVAFRLSEFLGAGAGQTASAATPTLARAAAGDMRPALRHVLGIASLIGAAVAAALALAAPLVVAVIGGDELDPATPVVRIQAVAIGLVFVVFNLGATLFALRRHAQLALTNAAGLIVVVVAALLLVPDHGAHGAAVASVIGEATMLVALGVLVTRAVTRRA